MITSLLLAAALAQPAPPQAGNAPFRVSLRIVASCDFNTAPAASCAGTDYDRWLREHANTRRLVDERGRHVIEVRF